MRYTPLKVRSSEGRWLLVLEDPETGAASVFADMGREVRLDDALGALQSAQRLAAAGDRQALRDLAGLEAEWPTLPKVRGRMSDLGDLVYDYIDQDGDEQDGDTRA